MIIIQMLVPVLFSIVFSIGLVIWWKRKTNIGVWPFVAGGICFFVFVMILESLLHSIVLKEGSPVYTNKTLYILYGALAAGIFEETARLFGFKVLLKKYTIDDKPCAIAYGIGHGGMEVLLVLGITYLMYLLAEMGIPVGDSATTQTLLANAEAIPFSMTLLAMFERISALMLHVGLSELMFIACKDKDKMYLYPIAIVLHAFADLFAVMYQVGIIKSLAVVEMPIFVFSIAVLIEGTKLLANSSCASKKTKSRH